MLKMEFIGGGILAAVFKAYAADVQDAVVKSVGRSALRLQSEVVLNRLSAGVGGKDGGPATLRTPARECFRQCRFGRSRYERPLRHRA
ncbi:hypothetical protein F9Z39_0784 [Neisseria gonorrhoeae]|nr:hypothetical protein F9Z35_0643 [Neisseria gonorrhoeae]KAE9497319.1 hypothetical protein F9Z37_0635 [Neisseria gonorrhoeae]KAE9501348.1 hypothetical protein F9Z38_2149 [Neisseria gonorrhoeae]KAE9502113.1 hypothetical protein F9Z39_0784 [Neisseria gonorrhoeae]KAE9505704.1 hypothetical protein F9Z40_0623 [Neisseria gonorrhoeae]